MIGDALADRDPARAGEQLLERALHGPFDRGDGTAVEGVSHHLLEHGLLGDVDRRVDVLEDVRELREPGRGDEHRAHADVGLERAAHEQRALADRVAARDGRALDVAPGDAWIDRGVVGEPGVTDVLDVDHVSHLAR